MTCEPPGGPTADLSLLLDSLPGLYGFWGTDQRNRYGNRAYADYFGVEPEQLQGMHYADLLGRQTYEEVLPHVAQALAGMPSSVDREFVDPSGRTTRVRCRYAPVLTAGQIVGFSVLVVDITAHSAVEQSAQEQAVARARAEQHSQLADAVHASVLQDLFAALIEIDGLERRVSAQVPTAPSAVDPVLHRLTELLGHAVRDLRRIADPAHARPGPPLAPGDEGGTGFLDMGKL